MKTEWDYTDLAHAYLTRPQYADGAIDRLLELAGVKPGDPVCDIGAGTAHLTLKLLERGLKVTAVEPNDAMRNLGRQCAPQADWHEATAEATGQPGQSFALVTFGSSFNVTDRPAALRESARLLRPGGWFACMWNHRDLNDPIQKKLETVIRSLVEHYDYGTRREDQTDVIDASGLFGTVQFVEASVQHNQEVQQIVEAWRSHATLQRQAGDKFRQVVDEMEAYLLGLGRRTIDVPYTTRLWCAPLANRD